MTVTVYRSDDTAAPLLTGEYGSLITLLDAVLVNGYGAKAAAGWTKEFSGTDQAVYRNSPIDGSGTFYQVDNGSGQANVSVSNIAYIRGASNCTGFDALTEVFGGNSWIATKKTNAATATQWIIVADQHSIILCTGGDTAAAQVAIQPTANFLVHYVGDSHGWNSLNVSAPVLAGQTHASSTTGYNALISNDNGIHPQKSPLGALESFSTVAVKYPLNGNRALAYPHTYNHASLYRGKESIKEVSYGTSSSSRTGIFRGIWFPCSGIFGATLDTFIIDGKSYLVVLTDEDADSVIFLEASNTWRLPE